MSVDEPVGVGAEYVEELQSGRHGSVYESLLHESVDSDGVYLPHHDISVSIDDYVSRVVDIQFDEDVGAPYWQEVHQELKEEYGDDFDIRDRVAEEGYAALRRYLPEADEDELKGRSVHAFRPAIYDAADIDLSKSSGTTGQKKRMPWTDDLSAAAIDWYKWNIDQRNDSNGDWIVSGPYGLYEEHLTGMVGDRGGIAFFTGIETKGIKNQLRAVGQVMETWGRAKNAASLETLRENPRETYDAVKDLFSLDMETIKAARKGMVRMEPTMTALEEDLRGEHIENIASAPAVVEQLYPVLGDERTKSSPEDIETILVSGMSVTEDTVANLEAMYENADVIPMYAASFTGPAFDDPDGEDEQISYYPMSPAVRLDVVDEETGELVEYGERGQVEINRIGPDFFWPNQRERETGVREQPTEHFDWDGVSQIEPL